MKNIIVCDLNREVIRNVPKEIQAIHGDYFQVAYQTPHSVLMTASNPRFSFGGGIDHTFTEHFPKLCEYKRMKGGEMERMGNIVFAITVNDQLKGSKEIIKNAIEFALSTLIDGEVLILSGIGTGVGGITPKVFGEVLQEIIGTQSNLPT